MSITVSCGLSRLFTGERDHLEANRLLNACLCTRSRFPRGDDTLYSSLVHQSLWRRRAELVWSSRYSCTRSTSILTNTQASDMVAQGATTTAAGKSKKSTTKHNFDKLNLRHFKRYREWYINMTNLISADRTQLKDLENGLITLAEFTAQHHDCDPENPFDMEEILKLYNENDADNYRILVTTRLHRNLDVGATARDMCKHTG